jgi:hypothetical protein
MMSKPLPRPALSHRLVIDPSLWGSKKTEASIVDHIVSGVPVPVLTMAHEQ